MIRHVVLMTWKEGVSEEQIAKVNETFAALPDKVPEIANSSFGPDLSIFPGNANYALILDFENERALQTYVAHPAHTELLESVTGPLMASWATAQFSI